MRGLLYGAIYMPLVALASVPLMLLRMVGGKGKAQPVAGAA